MAEAAAPPVPTITQVVPARGPVAGGTPIRILGNGLTTPDFVKVGDAKVTTFHFVSDTEVQIVTPPGVPGDADIVVTVNGQDSVGAPERKRFRYVAAPVITSAKETQRRWTGEGSIVIGGSDLLPVLSASIGGRAASLIDASESPITIKRSPGPSGDLPIIVVSDGGPSAPFPIWVDAGWTRVFVFVLANVYFAMLVALLLTYMLIPGFYNNLPSQLGPLPIVIPWTGALGAVTLSLSGVIYHTVHRDWDSNYLMWHVARPSLGAAFACIAYFIIAGGVLASGGTPNAQTTPVTPASPSPTLASPSAAATVTTTQTTVATAGPTATPTAATTTTSATSTTRTSATSTATRGSPATSAGGGLQNLFYIVVAFVIGYREQTFRQMIAKVGDLILGPAGGSSSGGGTTQPPSGGSGDPGQPESTDPGGPI
ncbi:MAG: IPT/TIG domain-containing protein [Candidatus Dormibacteraeota bacterium]|nr:IPT/TIG domain-containing protein [Candidatus Dormibacteraeota bacterium]